jgi:hypothetical protein
MLLGAKFFPTVEALSNLLRKKLVRGHKETGRRLMAHAMDGIQDCLRKLFYNIIDNTIIGVELIMRIRKEIFVGRGNDVNARTIERMLQSTGLSRLMVWVDQGMVDLEPCWIYIYRQGAKWVCDGRFDLLISGKMNTLIQDMCECEAFIQAKDLHVYGMVQEF